METADFSGYATKAGLKCSDGRTITAEAFKHMDGQTVPLVWQHAHDKPENVLGHGILEARPDGMYVHGFFNSTSQGENAKLLVQHEDVKALSIYANQLVEKSKSVLHGVIREVSLVLSGANPGALIDQIRIAHGEDEADVEVLEDEAIIYTGLELEHGGSSEEVVTEPKVDVPELEHAAPDATVQDVYDTLNDDQKQVVDFMIGAALEAAAASKTAAHSDSTDSTASTDSTDSIVSTDSTVNDTEGDLNHQEGNDAMTSRNVFEQNNTKAASTTLSHSDFAAIYADAQKPGQTFKSALKHHVENSETLMHSITNLQLLFPDALSTSGEPEWITRRMEWVSSVLNGTKHSPFAKVKTIMADITADEARAKGYVKGNLKTEEVLTLLRRTTSPTTIYKKQKLDRDDILDITDIDVVSWLKMEMRIMIEEELARAILVGDGRSAISPDKIKDPIGATDGIGIRSILNDNDLFSIKVDLAANVSPKEAVKGLVRARSKYRGTGKPTLFISDDFLTDIMLEEDKFGRPLYETEQALRDTLRVSDIVTVDLFIESQNLFAIMVSLSDYTIGANRGGELTSFEDFDIDYNQQKYLQETRLSGGLTKPYSAVVVRRAFGTLAVATAPSYAGATKTITIPVSTGVTYLINGAVVTGNVVITVVTEVDAVAAAGYYLAYNTTRAWTFTP